MSRRSKKPRAPASPFDFTGDEQILAERAYKARSFQKKTKISIMSISPVSKSVQRHRMSFSSPLKLPPPRIREAASAQKKIGVTKAKKRVVTRKRLRGSIPNRSQGESDGSSSPSPTPLISEEDAPFGVRRSTRRRMRSLMVRDHEMVTPKRRRFMLAVQPRFLRLSSFSLSASERSEENPVSMNMYKSSHSRCDQQGSIVLGADNSPSECRPGDKKVVSKISSHISIASVIKPLKATVNITLKDDVRTDNDSQEVAQGDQNRREQPGNSGILSNGVTPDSQTGMMKQQQTTSVEQLDEAGTRFNENETSQRKSTSLGLSTQEETTELLQSPASPARPAEGFLNALSDGKIQMIHPNLKANSIRAQRETFGTYCSSQQEKPTEASMGSTGEDDTPKPSVGSKKYANFDPSAQAASFDLCKAGESLSNKKDDCDTPLTKELAQDNSKAGRGSSCKSENSIEEAAEGSSKRESADLLISIDKNIIDLKKTEESGSFQRKDTNEKDVPVALPLSKKTALESPVTPLKSVKHGGIEGAPRRNEIPSTEGGIVKSKRDELPSSTSVDSKSEQLNPEATENTGGNPISSEDPNVFADGNASSKRVSALSDLAVATSAKTSKNLKRTADEENMMTPRAKRVRFSEPPSILKSASPKIGFSGITKLRRRRERQRHSFTVDIDDLSVVSMGASGPDRKAQQVLLDELQYLLDGIFKKQSSNTQKQRAADTAVLVSSLKTLVKLLLRKPKKRRLGQQESPESECGTLIQILVGQPTSLRNIVRRLCSVLGKSRTSDALVALVLVVIFRSTPKLCLVAETELEVLLNSFFRNAGGGLKEGEDEQSSHRKVSNDKESDGRRRRRGALGRRLESSKNEVGSMESLNTLLQAARVLDEHGSGFKTEMNVTTYLMSIAISYVLRYHEDGQMWMRKNRKLDKIVAVLYSCEKVMLCKDHKQSRPEDAELCLAGQERSAAWIGLGCSMRILEFAALDSVCQRRLADESRVGHLATVILRSRVEDNDGFLGTEWMVCSALRLCINLCHGCEEGSRKFVEANGHVLVLNCLMEECRQAGLLEGGTGEEVEKSKGSESFDIRVLCLAMLASIVNQDGMICSQFAGLVGRSEQFEHGTVSVVLSILKSAEGGANVAEEGEGQEREVKCLDRENEGWCVVIERKITVGYVCLLIGALAMGSEESRKTIEAILPGNSMVGVASVLAEFLEFHHEVGVISGSMDRMYANIIQKLVEPEMERHEMSISQGGGRTEEVGEAAGEAVKDGDSGSGEGIGKKDKDCKEDGDKEIESEAIETSCVRDKRGQL